MYFPKVHLDSSQIKVYQVPKTSKKISESNSICEGTTTCMQLNNEKANHV